jgi:hypothetical protein
MQQPPRYEVGGANMVCQLKRTLYSLKQAPRAWYTKMVEELAKIGFIPSEADPCLFLRQCEDSFTAVLTHDMLIAGIPEMVVHTELSLSRCSPPLAWVRRPSSRAWIERDREHLTLKPSRFMSCARAALQLGMRRTTSCRGSLLATPSLTATALYCPVPCPVIISL